MADARRVSSGVEELIERLRGEGVEAGRQEAARLLTEAQRRATQIVEDAERRANELMHDAREAAERERVATLESLRQAQRDALLAVKDELGRLFHERLRSLVHGQLRQPEVLAQLIEALAAGAAGTAPVRKIIASSPDSIDAAALQALLAGTARAMLEDGVALDTARVGEAGLRIGLGQDDVELHLTDEAISELLAEHLLPRFRAVLDGSGS